MKELLKESIHVIVGVSIGFGITKLLGICFDFIYIHFGKTGLYVSTFAGSIVLGTIMNYVVHKYVSDKGSEEDGMTDGEKHYIWIWVKNPYAKEMNNQPEKELRRYRVKEYKKNCVVLFDGRQFPYSAIVKKEVE